MTQCNPTASRQVVTDLSLSVNGVQHTLSVEPRRVLLDVLRMNLGLTGAKKVCEMGNCGACTVHLDGIPVYACLVLGVECQGHEITTIEGIAEGAELDPLQQAFIDADAFQCGYCTSGQIMSLKSIFANGAVPDDDEILRVISGNLCRCGAYRNIVKAAQLMKQRSSDAAGQSGGQTTDENAGEVPTGELIRPGASL